MKKSILSLLFLFSIGSFSMVNAQCPATISVFPSNVICQGNQVILTANANPASTFLWYRNGVSLDSTRNRLVVISTGSYYVNTMPCGMNSASVMIFVNPIPSSNFTYSPNVTSCASTPINFYGPTVHPLAYLWNFGDPASGVHNNDTAQNPTHIFEAYGNGSQNFTVELTTTNQYGCSSTSSQIVTVNQEPDATLTDPYDFPPFTLCSFGSDTFALTVRYSPVVITNNSQYQIQWGDGSPNWVSSTFPSSGVLHDYLSLGSFNLIFTITGDNGCQNSNLYQVFNGSNPSLTVGNPGSTTGCVPATFTFPIGGWQGNAPSTSYSFNFGDGSPVLTMFAPLPPTISHTYTTSSCTQQNLLYTYIVTAIASNPCGSTPLTIGGVQVSERPFAYFSTVDSVFCITDNIHFTNLAVPGCFIVGNNTNNSTNFTWNFGDGSSETFTNISPGNITTEASANHTYSLPGIYFVSLKATNFGTGGCGDSTYTVKICISGQPVSSFTLNQITSCKPMTVVTTNTSTATDLCHDRIYTWSVVFDSSLCDPKTGNWSFTSGSDLHSSNPSFIFTDPGFYTITLAVLNRCQTTYSSEMVFVKAVPAVTIPSLLPAICQDGTVNPTATFISCYGTISGYNWAFPGGIPSSSNQQIPGSFAYNTAGTYTITVSATNECGTTSENTILNVKQLPVITANPSSQSICNGNQTQAVSFSSSLSGTTYSWSATNPGGVGGVILSGTSSPIPIMALTNPTSSPQIVTYTIIPTTNGCQGAPITNVITVYPSPDVTNNPLSQSICSGQATEEVVLTSAVAGATFSWTATGTSGVSGFTTSGTSTIPSETLINSLFVDGIVTYTIIPSSNGCDGLPVIYIITVKPVPQITNDPLFNTICSGSTTNINLTSTVLGSTFSWTASCIAGVITGFSPSGSGNIIETLTNNSNIIGTVRYVIIPIRNGCSGIPTNFDVNVQPVSETVAVPPTQTICSGSQNVAIILTSNVSGSSFFWSATTLPPAGISGYIISGTGDTIPSETISSFLTTQGIVTYTATPSIGGCSGITSSYMIIVNPSPMITNIPMTQTVCSGNPSTPVILTSNVSTTNFTWTASGSANVTGFLSIGTDTIPSQTILNSDVTAGTVVYHIIPSSNLGMSCPGSPADYTINVNPLPTATANPSSSVICSGDPTNILLTANVLQTSFSWTVSLTSGSVTGQSNGTGDMITQTLINTGSTDGVVEYTITPIAAGCPGNAVSVFITVHPSPLVITMPATSQTICSGGTSNIGLSSNVSGSEFSWTASLTAGNINGFSDGSGILIAQTLNNTGIIPGIITYTIHGLANGCYGPDKIFQVIINPIPVLTTDPGNSQSLCSQLTTNIILYSNISGTTYSWIGSLTSGNITGFSSGTTDPIAQTLTNNGISAGIVTYDITPVFSGCYGSPFHFPVTVYPLPAVNAGPDLTIPCGTSGTLFGTAGGGTGTLFYNWTPTGFIASGQTTPTAVTTNLNSPVVFTLTVNDVVGCQNTDHATVNIVGACLSVNPQATPNPICAGQQTHITSNAFGGSSSYTYSWTSVPAGFFSSSANVDVSPNLTTTYNVVVNDGYNDVSGSIVITVNQLPTQFFVTGGGDYCSGGTGLSVGISGSQTGISYQLYKDGYTAGIPFVGTGNAFSFGNQTVAGTYTIVATNNLTSCTENMPGTAVIAIDPLPIANAGTDATIPFGTSTILSGTGTGGTGTLIYSWAPILDIASGGNTLSPSTTNLYVSTSFTLNISDSKGCTASDQTSVFLTGAPLSGSISASPMVICNNGSPVQLTAAVTGGSGNYTYNWSSVPAGFTSTQANPIVNPTQNTNYTVLINDGFNSFTSNSISITVNPLPLAFNITGGGNYCSGGNGLPVGLSGSEIGISYQLFNGSVAVNSPLSGTGNPLSFGTLTQPGIYTIIATNPVTSCTQNMSGNAVIIIDPLPVVNAGNDMTIPYGTSTTLSGSSNGGTGTLAYSWAPVSYISSGDNTLNPITTNLYNSTNFTLLVTDSRNCSSSDQVVVFLSGSQLSALASALPQVICSNGASVQLNSIGTGGSGTYTYSWGSNPPGFSSTQANPTVNPTQTTSFTVTINDGFNTAFSTVTVNVNPIPISYNVTGGGEYCYGGTGVPVFLSGSQPGILYQLLNNGSPVGGPLTGNGSSLSFGDQALAGNYTISATNLTTTCITFMNGSVAISINPLPITDAGLNKIIPYGTNTTLSGTASGGTGSLNYSWSPVIKIASGINTLNPATTNLYSNTTFTLTVSDSKSCVSSDQMMVILTGNPLTAQVQVTPDTICFGASVQLNSEGSGGSGIYTYSWVSNPPGSPIWNSNLQNPIVTPQQNTEYKVTINDGYNSASDSGNVIVLPLPVKYSQTGGGSYCFGGSGIPVGLNGSEVGVSYRLYRNGFAIGFPINGTGSPISFGDQTISGSYTTRGTRSVTGCTNWMSDTSVVTILPLPTAYLITGGGSYPQGGSGVPIGLSASDIGVNYRLVYGTDTLTPQPGIPGTGGPLSFGDQTLAGTYYVIAENSISGCTDEMLGNVIVIINSYPALFNVFGGGNICQGDPGKQIGLNGSEDNVQYILYRNGDSIATLPGTGDSLHYGIFNVTGTYTVKGINILNGLPKIMNGNAIINVNPLPVVFVMVPSGIVCPGQEVSLNGSQAGVYYSLLRGNDTIETIPGTGIWGYLNFGIQFTPGTYKIVGIIASTGCKSDMNGTMVMAPLPQRFNVTPAGANCSPTNVGLDGSQLGTTYQLYKNNILTGLPLTGTGGSLNFGLQTQGDYFVTGKIAATSCTDTMTGTVIITPGPSVYAGRDTAVCFLAVFQLNGQANSTSATLWTTTGDGSFANPASLNTIYYTGTNDKLIGNVKLFLHGYGQPECSQMQALDSLILTLHPNAIAHAGNDTIICPNVSVKLNGSATNYSGVQWTSIGGDGTFDNPSILQPHYNPGNSDISTGFVRLKLTVNGTQACSQQTSTDTVKVSFRALPTATLNGNASICYGNFANISVNLTGTSPWSFSYTDGLNIFTLNNVLSTPYTFSVNPTVTTTYTLFSVNNSFCNGTISGGPVTITVQPLPFSYQMTATGGGSYCEGGTGVVLGLEGSQSGISYQILLGGTPNGLPITGNGGPITFGNYTIPGIYKVRATNPQTFCHKIFNDSINLIEHHKPLVNFSIDSTCNGQITYFHIQGPDIGEIAQWQWNFGDGVITNYNSPVEPTHLYPTYGVYHVVMNVVDTNGCSTSIEHDAKVNTLPVAFFSFSAPMCSGVSVSFTDLSYTTGTNFITHWHWVFGDGKDTLVIWPGNPNISHIYNNPGNYTVTLTVKTNEGCSADLQRTISIEPHPIANFDYSAVCQNNITNFTDLSQTGGGGSIVEWYWNFGDPQSGTNNLSTLKDPVHIYSHIGNFVVRLLIISSNGCQDSINKTVHVNPAPAPNFNYAGICLGSPTQFSDVTVPNSSSILSWDWNFGDGSAHSSLQNPVHLYSIGGQFNVTLSIQNSNECINDTTITITILQKPTAEFQSDAPVCMGFPVQYTNLSNTLHGQIIRWNWNFGDGTDTIIEFPASPNVSHIFVGPGLQHLVTLTIKTTDSCVNSIQHIINSLPSPLANFSYSSTACAGLDVQFNDLTQLGGGPPIAIYTWNFGDPISGTANISHIQNPLHNFSSAGIYNVKLVVSNNNNCLDSITKSVVINATPIANFSADTACLGSATHFTDHSIPNAPSIASWDWDFGDGSTHSHGQNPIHLYAAAGIFTTTLTVTNSNGCSQTSGHFVLVLSNPVAAFIPGTNNCSGSPVAFTDQSFTAQGYIDKWIWVFGDGSTLTILSPPPQYVYHTYANGGTYNVSLTVITSTNCQSTVTNPLTIFFTPLANFTFSSSNCEKSAVHFTDSSQPNGGGALMAWNWNFGDPGSGINNTSTQQDPVHIYNSSGTYFVTLITTNIHGCQDTIRKPVTINRRPTALFTADSVCKGNITHFTDHSVPNNGTLIDWLWDFGDGTPNSTQQNPTHIYAISGIFNVNLAVTNSYGCHNDTTKQVLVYSIPVALFSYSGNCLGATTSFHDQSTSPGLTLTHWHWAFGDGDTSNLQNPTHIYSTPGTFTVILTVTNSRGCTEEYSSPVVIFNRPNAAFSYYSTYCPAGKVTFTDHSVGNGSPISDWFWTFEPGFYSSSANPTFIYSVTNMNYPVSLIVTDGNGCKDSIIDSSVFVKPGFRFTFIADTACVGSPTQFLAENLAEGDSLHDIHWDFDDPASGTYNNSTLYDPTHVFSGAGNYIVKMSAWDLNNCQDSVYKEVTVYTRPIANFTFDSVPHCDGIAIFYYKPNGNGAAVDTLVWNFGDGTITKELLSTSNVITHHYDLFGNYHVSLKTINVNDCQDTITKLVMINCITAGFTPVDTLACSNKRVTFSDNSVPLELINEWTWDFGDGTDTTYVKRAALIHHTYIQSQNYNVKLYIRSGQDKQMISDTMNHQISVQPTTLAEFAKTNVCQKDTARFLNLTDSITYRILSTQWNFGEPSSGMNDTSSLFNTTHSYDNPGKYKVRLVVQNQLGCFDTIFHKVTIYKHPKADFTVPNVCSRESVVFKNLSTSGDTIITVYSWQFGDSSNPVDTSNVKTPSYNYHKDGKYTVNLTVKDAFGCYDTIRKQETVIMSPISAFTISNDIDGIPGRIKMNDQSINAKLYEWDFGNGTKSNEENPIITYSNDGLYQIRLITWAANKCSDTTYIDYEFMFHNLFVPNALSPDNVIPEVRIFQPIGINLKEYHVEVFDGWGHLIWESNLLDDLGRPLESWDGTLNGEIVPQGTYVWKISAIFKDGTVWEGSDNGKGMGKTMGTVTVLR